MLDRHDTSRPASTEPDTTDVQALAFAHPDEVLHDARMSVEDKRAILAAWASDAHAVPNLPAMRQLPCGAIVTVDAVLAALSALDAPEPETRLRTATRHAWAKPRTPFSVAWLRPRRRDTDDDDDPPPCPATAVPAGLRRGPPRHLGAVCSPSAA